MLKGYRTVIWNVLSFLVYALAYPTLQGVVDPQYLLLAGAIINLLLRFMTDTPVGYRS